MFSDVKMEELIQQFGCLEIDALQHDVDEILRCYFDMCANIDKNRLLLKKISINYTERNLYDNIVRIIGEKGYIACLLEIMPLIDEYIAIVFDESEEQYYAKSSFSLGGFL